MNIAVDGVISGGSFSENTSVQNWNGEITGGTFDCPMRKISMIVTVGRIAGKSM